MKDKPEFTTGRIYVAAWVDGQPPSDEDFVDASGLISNFQMESDLTLDDVRNTVMGSIGYSVSEMEAADPPPEEGE